MRSVNLTEGELQALGELMDAGVKYLGLRSVKNATALLIKIESAEEIKPPDLKAVKESTTGP